MMPTQKRVSVSVLIILAGFSRASAALPAFGNDQPASLVVGQSNMASNAGAAASTALNLPQGVCTAGTKLIVADTPNNRVLIYDRLPAGNGAAADVVIGQADMNSSSANQAGSGAAANTLSSPQGVYSDGVKLYISDTGNNRVLIFNAVPTANNASADVAVGQANKNSNSANQGGIAAANTLQAPAGLYSDGTKLYIADAGNGRVLIYDAIPATDGASSDLALTLEQNGGSMSQPRAVSSDGTKLFISDPNNSAFLIYNSTPSFNVAPDVQLATAAFGAFSDGTKLYLADASESRVLIYNSIPASNAATPDGELGQTDLSGILPNQGGAAPSAATLSAPDGISSDGTRLYVADTSNNRVMIYGPATATLGSPANSSYVSTTAPTLTWSTSTPAASEIQLATDAGFVGVIADTITTNAFYVSTNTLTNGANYWWRVGIAGGSWSMPANFTVDIAPPAYSGPQVSASSGAWTSLNGNVYISTNVISAKIAVQDALSGLLTSTGLPAGLVAQWHLDESSGTTTLDASPNSFNGTVVNGATRTAGRIGGAVNFNGNQQYVSLSTMNVDYSNGFSAEAWVYYNGFNSWSRILDFGNGPFSDNIVFANNSTSGNLTFQVYAGATPGSAVTAAFALTTGQWTHLAATESGSGAVVLYRNGVAIASGTANVPNSINRTSNYLAQSNWSTDGYLNGALDEVRIFNVPLSSSQVLADYQSDTLNAHNRGQAYTVLYSTTAGASWNFVSTHSVTLGGANGTTAAQTLEADNIPVVASAGPGAATNQVAFVASDFSGNVSTAVYTILVSAPPGAPAVVAVSTNGISATWTAVNSNGYELDASTAPNFSGAIFSSTTANGASEGLTVTPLSANATYYLRVGALWGATTNYASAVMSTATPTAVPAYLGTSSATFASVTADSATVAWGADNNSARTVYTLQVSTAADFTGTLTSSATTSTQATVSGLAGGTTYYFRVNAAGFAGMSTIFTFLGSTPTPPFGAVSAVSINSISVSWAAVNSNGYEVDASTAADFSGVIFSSRTTNGASTGLTVTALSVNTTYYLRAGELAGGATTYSPAVSSCTLAAAPSYLGTNSATFVSVTASSATAAWGPDNDPAGTVYTLQVSTASNFSGTLTSSATMSAQAAVSGLSSNTTYYFRAKATNFAGTDTAFLVLGSTWTVFAGPAPRPSTLSAVVVASATIRWTWTENGGTAASFGLHSSTGGLITPLPAGTSFYMETGLSTSTAYARYVMSLNPAGQAQSSTVTVATPSLQSALTGTGSGTLLGTDGGEVQIPSALLANNVEWIISENPVQHPLTDATAALIGQASPPSGLSASPASLTEFIVAVNGARFASALAEQVTVSVPYLDANGDGIVDGTGIRASTLSLYTLNENTGQWDPVPGSYVDTVNHLVVGSIGHLSIFDAFGTSAQNDLSAMRVYPVPFKPNSGDPNQGVPFSPGNPNSGIVFDNMPAQTTIKIYTLTGKQVIELDSTGASGSLQWDARNADGRDVASGGYLAVITSPGAPMIVRKLLVIR